MGHEKWILGSHMIWPGSLPGTGLKASKFPFLGLQEAGLSDESKSKGGYLRHFVLVLKQAVPGSRAVWLQSAIRSGAAASPLLPLRVAGSRLCYFSTEDSASWDTPPPPPPLGNWAGTPWLFTLGSSACLIRCPWQAVLEIGAWGLNEDSESEGLTQIPLKCVLWAPFSFSSCLRHLFNPFCPILSERRWNPVVSLSPSP